MVDTDDANQSKPRLHQRVWKRNRISRNPKRLQGSGYASLFLVLDLAFFFDGQFRFLLLFFFPLISFASFTHFNYSYHGFNKT